MDKGPEGGAQRHGQELAKQIEKLCTELAVESEGPEFSISSILRPNPDEMGHL